MKKREMEVKVKRELYERIIVFIVRFGSKLDYEVNI